MVVFAMARFIYVCEDQIKAIRGEEGEKKYRTKMLLYYVETSVKEILRYEWLSKVRSVALKVVARVPTTCLLLKMDNNTIIY